MLHPFRACDPTYGVSFRCVHPDWQDSKRIAVVRQTGFLQTAVSKATRRIWFTCTAGFRRRVTSDTALPFGANFRLGDPDEANDAASMARAAAWAMINSR